MMTECMGQTVELSKKSEINTFPQDTDESSVDIAISFDGFWKLPGCSSTITVTATIAQNASQLVDVVLKSSTCREFEENKEKCKPRRIGKVAYID